MNEDRMLIANRLRYVMEEQNVSGRKLAELTHIPKSSIAHYLSGSSPIPVDRLEIMSNALQVATAYLLGWTPRPDGLIPTNAIPNADITGGIAITAEEAELVINFRKLNASGKSIALYMIHSMGNNPETRKGD